jgi:hypothetical protein
LFAIALAFMPASLNEIAAKSGRSCGLFFAGRVKDSLMGES